MAMGKNDFLVYQKEITQMNERIKQLLEQAGFYVADGKIYTPTTSEDITACQTKVAELIVRECLNIAKNREDELENANLLKESNAVGIVAYRIARQFGVNE